jgi:hypothetical protein
MGNTIDYQNIRPAIMQAIKWIYLTMFFNICFSSLSFGQTSKLDPDKHLLIKNKIKKYEIETLYYFNNSDSSETWLSTFLLNEFASVLSVSRVSLHLNSKTIYEYVHDMLPSSKSEYKNNSSIASTTITYEYDSEYLLKEELEFDSLDNLIHHKTYDKQGNVIEEIDNSDSEVTKRSTKNKYNEQGDILESISVRPDETTEKVYFYKDGLLTREESSYIEEYKNYFIEYNIYNENRQLISQHSRHSNKHKGQQFKLRSSTQYEYDHEGKLIKKRHINKIKNPKDVDDNTGFSMDEIIEGETRIITYEYNDMGLISKIFITSNGKPVTVYSFKYFQ